MSSVLFHICIQCVSFRILEIVPLHAQGQHNLCVVYVERGLLLEVKREKCDTYSDLTNIFFQGKECFEKALALAPEEKYIQNHLNIVSKKINAMSQKN